MSPRFLIKWTVIISDRHTGWCIDGKTDIQYQNVPELTQIQKNLLYFEGSPVFRHHSLKHFRLSDTQQLIARIKIKSLWSEQLHKDSLPSLRYACSIRYCHKATTWNNFKIYLASGSRTKSLKPKPLDLRNPPFRETGFIYLQRFITPWQ